MTNWLLCKRWWTWRFSHSRPEVVSRVPLGKFKDSTVVWWALRTRPFRVYKQISLNVHTVRTSLYWGGQVWIALTRSKKMAYCKAGADSEMEWHDTMFRETSRRENTDSALSAISLFQFTHRHPCPYVQTGITVNCELRLTVSYRPIRMGRRCDHLQTAKKI